MKRWAAFLRAINVGGRTIKMEPLRTIFRDLGHGDVATYIASGNVMFTAAGERAALEAGAEAALREALGYEVATFLRTGDELEAVLAAPPLEEARELGVPTAYVGFTRQALSALETGAVDALATDADTIRVVGAEIYWLPAGKVSDAKLTGGSFEKALGRAVTFRNDRTVQAVRSRLG